MEFKPGILLLVTGLAAMLIVVLARWLESRSWRASLVAYRIRFPKDLAVDSIAAALSITAEVTRRRPLVFETVAQCDGITHYVLIPDRLAAGVVTRLVVAMPGIRMDEVPAYLRSFSGIRLARELRVTRALWPLASKRAEVAVSAVLASLFPLALGESVRLQWVFAGAAHIRVRGEHPTRDLKEVDEKQRVPLLNASGRIAVSAPQRGRARLLMSGMLNSLGIVSRPGVSLTARMLPTSVVAGRVYRRALPLTRWPGLLNVSEAASLVGIPAESITVPGLTVGASRQLPVPPEMPRSGLVIAESNYPGMGGRPVTLATTDRLRHMVVAGPTGTGKSVLITRCVGQDIAAGRGLFVIDPKSDLVDEILRRIPEHRLDDVIVMDPSATQHPVGFNILKATDEQSRDLVVDRVVHIFSQLWRNSWGPRTADVLRSCLLSLTNTRAPNGMAFTLTEIPELLTNATFRRYVVARSPETVRDFWDAYEAMSLGERQQVVGPALTKLRAFTTRSSLRLMLGQSEGIDLGDVFRRRKILLVPLSKGVIGPEAAHLLGSLLVASLWQETLSRTRIPAEQRVPVFGYLDEFQEFIRLGSGDELADMLAQARGLGLGLVLAHQYLDQLSPDISAAVLGTIRTQAVYQIEYRDAQTMARRFAPLTGDDLTGLDAFEIAVRPCVNGRTIAPVTGRTLPLDEPIRDPAEVLARSLEKHGAARSEVESARKARILLQRSDKRYDGSAPIGEES